MVEAFGIDSLPEGLLRAILLGGLSASRCSTSK